MIYLHHNSLCPFFRPTALFGIIQINKWCIQKILRIWEFGSSAKAKNRRGMNEYIIYIYIYINLCVMFGISINSLSNFMLYRWKIHQMMSTYHCFLSYRVLYSSTGTYRDRLHATSHLLYSRPNCIYFLMKLDHHTNIETFHIVDDDSLK